MIDLLQGRKYIIGRGDKRYQWDILPISVRHVLTDTNTGFKTLEYISDCIAIHTFWQYPMDMS